MRSYDEIQKGKSNEGLKKEQMEALSSSSGLFLAFAFFSFFKHHEGSNVQFSDIKIIENEDDRSKEIKEDEAISETGKFLAYSLLSSFYFASLGTDIHYTAKSTFSYFMKKIFFTSGTSKTSSSTALITKEDAGISSRNLSHP